MEGLSARELRIGNWVYNNEGERDEEVDLSFFEFLSTEEYDLDYYDPIPLTEEWLLRFGFEKLVFNSEVTGYGFEYLIALIEKDEYIVVCDDMSVGTYSSGDFAHVIYPNKYHIHQLQNLYVALTGEELTIKK